jgi:hypothetical protein
MVRAMSTRGTGANPTFIPAARQSRINVLSALRAPNIKAPTRPSLTVRPGTILLAGTVTERLDTAANLRAADNVFTARTVISSTSEGPLTGLLFRTAPTVRRPASMPMASAIDIPPAQAAPTTTATS